MWQSRSAYCERRKAFVTARKGAGGTLPGVEVRPSEERVFDGRRNPNPDDSPYYRLLLGDGDINDRGEGNEGSNTPVCRLRGVHQDVEAEAIASRDRTCAKTDFF